MCDLSQIQNKPKIQNYTEHNAAVTANEAVTCQRLVGP